MNLREMQDIHINDIDPNTVINAADIDIKSDLPQSERMIDVLQQMNGNPYFFKVGKVLVKISFADTDITINQRWEDYLRTA